MTVKKKGGGRGRWTEGKNVEMVTFAYIYIYVYRAQGPIRRGKRSAIVGHKRKEGRTKSVNRSENIHMWMCDVVLHWKNKSRNMGLISTDRSN